MINIELHIYIIMDGCEVQNGIVFENKQRIHATIWDYLCLQRNELNDKKINDIIDNEFKIQRHCNIVILGFLL